MNIVARVFSGYKETYKKIYKDVVKRAYLHENIHYNDMVCLTQSLDYYVLNLKI